MIPSVIVDQDAVKDAGRFVLPDSVESLEQDIAGDEFYKFPADAVKNELLP